MLSVAEAHSRLGPEGYNDLLRNQRLQVCEIAYRGLEEHSDAVLRWFATEVLHFPAAWAHVVALALFEKNKAGELRWRGAANPVGLIRTIAWRAALNWHPDLIFGNRALLVVNRRELLLTDAIGAAFSDHDSPLNSARFADCGDTYQDRMDRLSFDYESKHWYEDDDGEEEPWRWALDEKLYSELDSPIVLGDGDSAIVYGLQYDWDEIGRRMGFSDKQVQLMKARARGVTRERMGRHLGWDEHVVQAVWRSVTRKLANPATARHAHEALLDRMYKI